MLAVNLKTPSPLCLTPSGPAEPPAAPNPCLGGPQRQGWVCSLLGSLCPQGVQQGPSSSSVVTGGLKRLRPSPCPSWGLNVPPARKQAQLNPGTGWGWGKGSAFN